MFELPKLYQLLYQGKHQRLRKGEMLPSSDENQQLTVIKSGFVKRYLISNDGTLGVQIIYGPGSVFPLTFMFRTLFDQSIYRGPEVYHYETMATTEIYSVNRERLLEMAQTDPEIYKDLLSEAGRHLEASVQRLENLTLSTYYKQVAHQLLYFGSVFGRKVGNKVVVKLPLTHQDVADVLSCTRETASLCIADLRKKRLISVGPGKHIIIHDMAKLKTEAYS